MPKIIDNRSVLAKLFRNILEVRFIARQHAMQTDRDIALPIPSVCLSNADIVSNKLTHRHTLPARRVA